MGGHSQDEDNEQARRRRVRRAVVVHRLRWEERRWIPRLNGVKTMTAMAKPLYQGLRRILTAVSWWCGKETRFTTRWFWVRWW